MLNFWGSQFSGIEKKMCNFQKYSDIIIRFCWWVGDDDADGEMIFSWNTLFPNVFDRYMSLGPLISLAHLFSHLIGQYIKPRNVKHLKKWKYKTQKSLVSLSFLIFLGERWIKELIDIADDIVLLMVGSTQNNGKCSRAYWQMDENYWRISTHGSIYHQL